MRSDRIGVAALLLGIWAGSCGCSPFSPPQRPNVLLVTVDTLRADHLSSYGFALRTTPQVDALAERGVLFERAIAAASTTAPAHASIMTSRYTRGHSIGFLNGGTRLEGAATVAEAFREAGYRTAGFVGNALLERRHGFDRGFETYDDELPTPELNRPLLYRERSAEKTTNRAIAWLDVRAAEPVFLWVHYQDPHGPYTPPPDFVGRFQVTAPPDEQPLPVVESELPWDAIPSYQALEGLSLPSEYRSRYAAEIAYVDESIGRLVRTFERLGREAVILLTADHGESLGEDGRYFMHGFGTTPQLAHVPLILLGPELPAGRRTEIVHHIDIAPTLLELAGLPPLEDARGLALGPYLRGSRPIPGRLVYSDIGSEVSGYRDRHIFRALGTRGAWSPSQARSSEPIWFSYEWRGGDGWSRIQGVAVPKAEMRAYLEHAVALAPAPLDPERREELRALGYVVEEP